MGVRVYNKKGIMDRVSGVLVGVNIGFYLDDATAGFLLVNDFLVV